MKKCLKCSKKKKKKGRSDVEVYDIYEWNLSEIFVWTKENLTKD